MPSTILMQIAPFTNPAPSTIIPGMVSPFNNHLNIIYALASRDVRARYRRSLLGPLWAILQPLFLMVVFTLLRGILNASSSDIPYVIFSYSVLVPWTYFSNIVTRAAPSIIGNGNIIKKSKVPRLIFPLIAVATSIFDAAMAGLVLVGMMLWFGVPVNLSILWLVILIPMISALGVGMGLFFAALGVYRRDFLQINTFFLQALLYASPIIYAVDEIPERWRALYQLNPLVGILEGFRNVLARGQAPDVDLLVMALPGLILIWAISYPLFRYTSRYFADVL